MPVQKVRLGPFVGGLSTFSDPTAIEDVEVAKLINFEPDIDGSLVNRPPIEAIPGDIPGGAGASVNVLGFYEANTGAKYLIASNRLDATYYWTGTVWTLITNTIAATAMAQFRDDLWLVAAPASVNPGGKWNPTGGFVPDANMPKGGCAVTFKERVWVGPGATATSNGSRLYLSSLSAGAVSWPAVPNFLQIGAGDGQNIIDLTVYAESILVFKRGSTYRYAFNTDPAVGVVSRVSDNIGALAKNCFASYQNDLYVLFDNKVYQFTNYNYTQLNIKVPLKADNPSVTLTEYASISVWSDRLFVQYYDTTYVYSLRVRTWCIWESTLLANMGRVYAIPGEQGIEPRAYTYSVDTSEGLGLYQITDVIGDASEPMTCVVLTKNYDYLAPDTFKRLVSWGADVISKVDITSKAIPVVYGQMYTWDQVRDYAGAPGGYLNTGERINLARHPRTTTSGVDQVMSAGGGAGWGGVQPVLSSFADVSAPSGGGYCTRYTKVAAGASTLSADALVAPAQNRPTVTPGKSYVSVLFVRPSINFTLYPQLQWLTGVGGPAGTTTGGPVNCPANTWTMLTIIGVAPGTAASVRPDVDWGEAKVIPAGFTLDSDFLTVEEGTSVDPNTPSFHGGTADVLGDPAHWNGTIDNSTSTIFRYAYQPYGATWGWIKAMGGTWDRPIDPAVEVVDYVETGGAGSGRKYVKFLKSVRFRQIAFELSVSTEGDTTTSPVRIFNIITRYSEKGGASRKIS